ncbi:hypothetical protein [Rudaeicoccus suwonensis]|uniref:Uncharacterized protein n=1 Tax=Rudaeicoccus suwonensis TaxID=657409 RepID=A0A561DV89_9MICO|nr:hypothetical protein [Rudaeicoccus suwonensis]TWE07281.1 hypothetical protein BKA23_3463 [Rudaeicoccus suwonensis]
MSHQTAESDGPLRDGARGGVLSPRRWSPDAWLAFSVLAVLMTFCGYAVVTGLPFAALVRLGVVAVVVQWLPGVLIWRCLRPSHGWLMEDLACGFACGFALSIPAQVVGGLADSAVLSAAIPLVTTAILLGVRSTRARILAARWSPTPRWLSALIVVGAAATGRDLFSFFRQNKLHWPVGTAGKPHVDQYFQIAMTNELRFRGPVNWPMIAGESFDYHWFAHAWMAQLSSVANVSATDVVLRFAPAFLPVVAVAAIAAVALRMTGSAFAAGASALIAMWGGYVDLWNTGRVAAPLTPLSPTLAPSLVALMALASLVTIRLRGDRRWGGAVALCVFAIVAAGAKGSATPLLVAGLALAAVAALLWNRRMLRPLLVDTACVAAGLLISIKVIFNGSTDALTFDPPQALQSSWPIAAIGGTHSFWLLVAGGVVMVFWGISKAVLGLPLLMRRDHLLGRADPVVWVLLGGAVAGAFGPALFVQPGVSQNYFRIQAIPLAAVLSGAGAFIWLRERRWPQTGTALLVVAIASVLAYAVPVRLIAIQHGHSAGPYLVLLIGALICLTGGVAVALSSPTRRRQLVAFGTMAVLLGTGVPSTVVGLWQSGVAKFGPVSPTSEGAVTQGQLDAAMYIGAHSAPDAVVMTNRHCTTPRPVHGMCDSRWFLVSAYSGRQVLVEGWGYSPTITARYVRGSTSLTAPFFDQPLLRLNDGFYTSPTEAAARELWQRGVRWIYVDALTTPGVDLRGYAVLEYDNPAASVWRLNRP